MTRYWMFGAAALGLLAAPLAAQQDGSGRREVILRRDLRSTPQTFSVTITGHGRIGVTVDLRPSANDSIGATVQGVTPGGPAAQAGVRAGDIIVRFNGTALVDRGARASRNDGGEPQSHPGLRLLDLASKLGVGDTVAVEYRRGKDRKTIQLVTSDLGGVINWARTGDTEPFMFQGAPGGSFVYGFKVPSPGDFTRLRGFSFDQSGPDAGNQVFLRFGSPLGSMEFAPINPDLGRYFGVSEGVLVLSVPDSAPLALRPGDVILSVGDRKPTSVSKLLDILRTYDDSETVHLDVMRDHKHITVSGAADWDRPLWDRAGGFEVRNLQDR